MKSKSRREREKTRKRTIIGNKIKRQRRGGGKQEGILKKRWKEEEKDEYSKSNVKRKWKHKRGGGGEGGDEDEDEDKKIKKKLEEGNEEGGNEWVVIWNKLIIKFTYIERLTDHCGEGREQNTCTNSFVAQHNRDFGEARLIRLKLTCKGRFRSVGIEK